MYVVQLYRYLNNGNCQLDVAPVVAPLPPHIASLVAPLVAPLRPPAPHSSFLHPVTYF